MQFNTKITKEEVEMEKIKRFFKEEEGVTSLEYGLIAAADLYRHHRSSTL